MFGKKVSSEPLIIDISENRVTVIDYSVDTKTGNTLIQGIGQTQLPFGVVSTNTIEQETALIQAIENARLEAEIRNKDEEKTSIVLGVSGPLVEIKDRIVEINRDKSQKSIKLKEWINTIDDIYVQFDEEVYTTSQGHKLPLSLAQISLNDIRLDGEQILSPIGEKSQTISLETLNTYIPTVYKQSLLNIEKSIGLSIEGVYQHGYAVGQLILDYNSSRDISVILVDIRFGHTTISIIQNQKIRYIQSFSMGSHSFTQAIANTFQITIDEAETVRQEYSRLQLPRDMSRRITDALEPEISLWLQGIILSLQEAQLENLPPHVLLYGEGAQLLGVKEALEYSNWYKSLNSSIKPGISILTPKQFPHIIDMTSKIDDALYIDILGLIHAANIPTDIHLPYRLSE
jgi:cell division ATPase FtsA